MAKVTGRSTSSKPGTVRRRSGVWAPTEVQRSYRQLLDLAKRSPQTIRDKDGSLLILKSQPTAEFEHELAKQVAEIARFESVYAANRTKAPRSWARQTPYPYLAALSKAEVDDFAHELLAYTLDAAQRGTLENLRGNLRAWRSTVEIYEDREALAEMTAPIDHGKLAEVFPPKDLEE